MFAALKVRERNSRSGSIGSAGRASQPTKATMPTMPSVERGDDLGLVPAKLVAANEAVDQREEPAVMIPGRAGRAAASGRRSRSGRSARAGSRPARSARSARRSTARRGLRRSAPPTSGPIAIASPATPPQAPRATARRSCGTAADRMVRVSGVMIAPPTPWMARAAMRTLDASWTVRRSPSRR